MRLQFVLFVCAIGISSGIQSIPRRRSARNSSDLMETLVDFRGHPPHEYRQANRRIASLLPFSTLDIEFDLRVRPVDRDYSKIRILCMESDNARLTLYLNGWGEFGIMHYNKKYDRFGHDTVLLDCNLFVALRAPSRDFVHYHIRIVDNEQITVNINGLSMTEQIKREICPRDEMMWIWMDKQGFKVNGAIKNLFIRSLTVNSLNALSVANTKS